MADRQERDNIYHQGLKSNLESYERGDYISNSNGNNSSINLYVIYLPAENSSSSKNVHSSRYQDEGAVDHYFPFPVLSNLPCRAAPSRAKDV
jgi:hypothetical protein